MVGTDLVVTPLRETPLFRRGGRWPYLTVDSTDGNEVVVGCRGEREPRMHHRRTWRHPPSLLAPGEESRRAPLLLLLQDPAMAARLPRIKPRLFLFACSGCRCTAIDEEDDKRRVAEEALQRPSGPACPPTWKSVDGRADRGPPMVGRAPPPRRAGGSRHRSSQRKSRGTARARDVRCGRGSGPGRRRRG